MVSGDNPATSGSDFTELSGTLTFGDGVGTRNILVDLLADSTFDAFVTETFTVELYGATNAVLAGSDDDGTASVVVTVIDSDSPPLVSWSNTQERVVDEAQSIDVQISRVGVLGGSSTVDVVVEDGTAVAGEDYTAIAGTTAVEFLPGPWRRVTPCNRAPARPHLPAHGMRSCQPAACMLCVACARR